jgi:hypothetical protein
VEFVSGADLKSYNASSSDSFEMAKRITHKQLSDAIRACAAAGEYLHGHALVKAARKADARLRFCTFCLVCGQKVSAKKLIYTITLHQAGFRNCYGRVHLACAPDLILPGIDLEFSGASLGPTMQDWKMAWAGVMKRNVW